MSLTKDLLEDGLKYGLCEKFQNLMQEELSENALCGLYHKGLDFCIQHNWPGREFVERFDKSILTKNGIIYDQKDIKLVNLQNIVVNGDSDIHIYVGFVSDITIRDNSIVHLHMMKGGFAYISMRDNCKVIIEQKDQYSRLCASVFGGTITQPEQFDKIINKNQNK